MRYLKKLNPACLIKNKRKDQILTLHWQCLPHWGAFSSPPDCSTLREKPLALIKQKNGTWMWIRCHDTTLCWDPVGTAQTQHHHGEKARFQHCLTVSQTHTWGTLCVENIHRKYERYCFSCLGLKAEFSRNFKLLARLRCHPSQMRAACLPPQHPLSAAPPH